MTKLTTEYHGFLKFIRRANQEVISWFGPHCNNDPNRITLMAAREWEGMADSERYHFIKANRLDSRQGGQSGSHPFLCYLLHKRHSNFLGTNRATDNGIVHQSLFHPELGRANALDWRAMSKTEREKYAGIRVADLGIDHVIENREKLHDMFDPKELSILEFILKTKPKKPNSPRIWFIRMESLRGGSPEAKERWCSLTPEDRRFYEVCTRLDKQRFQFEKDAWITKLLSTNFERDDLTLGDFEAIKVNTSVETIGNLIEMNKGLLPNLDRPKRPLGPFSLFVRDYRYQIRANKPEFRFGQHLKETSEAWTRLTEEERQFYKDISNELRESFNQAHKAYKSTTSTTEREICGLLFRHQKAVTGPSKPSHLTVRVPNVIEIYGKANGIKRSHLKEAWNSLSDADKEPYIREYDETKAKSDIRRAKIKAKRDYIDTLIRKSEELERVKKGLHLLRTRNRPIKGMTDSL